MLSTRILASSVCVALAVATGAVSSTAAASAGRGDVSRDDLPRAASVIAIYPKLAAKNPRTLHQGANVETGVLECRADVDRGIQGVHAYYYEQYSEPKAGQDTPTTLLVRYASRHDATHAVRQLRAIAERCEGTHDKGSERIHRIASPRLADGGRVAYRVRERIGSGVYHLLLLHYRVDNRVVTTYVENDRYRKGGAMRLPALDDAVRLAKAQVRAAS